MAQIVTVGTQTYKKRNVIAVWLGLPLITLGIYSVRLDLQGQRRGASLSERQLDPARRCRCSHSSPEPLSSCRRSSPSIAPANGSRGWRPQAGSPNRAEPVVGLILGFVFCLYSLYYQDHLNGLWDRYLQPGYAIQPRTATPTAATTSVGSSTDSTAAPAARTRPTPGAASGVDGRRMYRYVVTVSNPNRS